VYYNFRCDITGTKNCESECNEVCDKDVNTGFKPVSYGTYGTIDVCKAIAVHYSKISRFNADDTNWPEMSVW